MKIIIPKYFMGEPIEGSLERALEASKQTSSSSSANVPPVSSIQSNNEEWEISGVQYRNGFCDVGLAKTLLDNGISRNQTDWASHYESVKGKNEFHAMDYPLLYGIVKALYTQRNDSTKAVEIAEAQKFL